VSDGQKLLESAPTREFIRNKMSRDEISFANEILDLRGGKLEGNVLKADQAAIDGTLNGKYIQIKELSKSGSLQKILKHASQAEKKAINANYSGIELYMNTPNFTKNQIIDFAKGGPLSKIPSQGTIDSIYIKASDGWMIIK
jgi:hypothetical protein